MANLDVVVKDAAQSWAKTGTKILDAVYPLATAVLNISLEERVADRSLQHLLHTFFMIVAQLLMFIGEPKDFATK